MVWVAQGVHQMLFIRELLAFVIIYAIFLALSFFFEVWSKLQLCIAIRVHLHAYSIVNFSFERKGGGVQTLY